MRHLKLILVSLSVILFLTGCGGAKASNLPEGAVKKDFSVAGMYCGSCSVAIETGLKSMNGVYDANLSFITKKGFVTYDPTIHTLDDFRVIAEPYEITFK